VSAARIADTVALAAPTDRRGTVRMRLLRPSRLAV